MISDFWAKKLPNSGMTHFNISKFDRKKLFRMVFTVNCYWLPIFGANFYRILILGLNFTDFWFLGQDFTDYQILGINFTD